MTTPPNAPDAATSLVVRPDAHERDPLGALLNPDTGHRYPSLDRRDAADLAALCEEYGIAGDARDAVQLLVLRARTRLAREHASRLRQAAEYEEREARRRVALMRDDEPAAIELEFAARHAAAARTLRGVVL